MQYILTESEYNDLRIERDLKINFDQEKLQTLCTKIANEMPVLWGWSKDEKPKPWGCMLTSEEEWYCDSCPVKEICPYQFKEWSK